MGLQPSEVRRLTLPQYLVIADAYGEAHTPPDKRGPPRATSAQIAALKRLEAQNG